MRLRFNPTNQKRRWTALLGAWICFSTTYVNTEYLNCTLAHDGIEGLGEVSDCADAWYRDRVAISNCTPVPANQSIVRSQTLLDRLQHAAIESAVEIAGNLSSRTIQFSNSILENETTKLLIADFEMRLCYAQSFDPGPEASEVVIEIAQVQSPAAATPEIVESTINTAVTSSPEITVAGNSQSGILESRFLRMTRDDLFGPRSVLHSNLHKSFLTKLALEEYMPYDMAVDYNDKYISSTIEVEAPTSLTSSIEPIVKRIVNDAQSTILMSKVIVDNSIAAASNQEWICELGKRIADHDFSQQIDVSTEPDAPSLTILGWNFSGEIAALQSLFGSTVIVHLDRWDADTSEEFQLTRPPMLVDPRTEEAMNSVASEATEVAQPSKIDDSVESAPDYEMALYYMDRAKAFIDDFFDKESDDLLDAKLVDEIATDPWNQSIDPGTPNIEESSEHTSTETASLPDEATPSVGQR